MNCEICDKRVQALVKIRLEGAVMNVCEACAKFGQRIETPKSVLSVSGGAVVFAPKRREAELSKEDIVENYAPLVKSAREKKGWTQEQLAREIQEKEFLIHRIEQGRMQPTIELAKKLQRQLGIRLITMVTDENVETGGISGSAKPTLGDYIKIKKKGN